ncbi:hypothetical protein H8356DRAFT_1372380 [Neocallimastix lanati (nom. inval.)]|nr:hypothetical protein H8356DRAFT_1372380 [Neocallimastix sp. JGI-2020a]
MRKYHNRIKQNILNECKGNLLDIGSGNSGDLHKWRNYKRAVCIEPDLEKIKNFKERIKTSEIKDRIVLYQNNIQNIDIDQKFNITTCFFALNDFNYSDVEDILKNISKNINGMFIVLFFDYCLFKDDIDSPCVKYRQCINPCTNKFINKTDMNSPTYLSLRYAHKECNNIMYVDISGSNLLNNIDNLCVSV